jgi:hypothetical protein
MEMGERMSGLFSSLLNRHVTIESSGLKISGRLVAVSNSQRLPSRRPYVLVLETPMGPSLVRNWNVISFSEKA